MGTYGINRCTIFVQTLCMSIDVDEYTLNVLIEESQIRQCLRICSNLSFTPSQTLSHPRHSRVSHLLTILPVGLGENPLPVDHRHKEALSNDQNRTPIRSQI